MLRFNDDADAGCVGDRLNCLGNLFGQILLNLQPPCVHINDPCDLTEAKDLSRGEIGDVTFSDKGQQVVLAHGIQFDILNNDHLTRIRLEKGVINDFR